MKTLDDDLRERLAPLRDLEPSDEEIARLLASADELRARTRRPRRPLRAVAVVAACAAAIGGGLAALPGGRDAARPRSAHGILEAAAAVAAEQPAPGAYRYTRMLSRFVDEVRADGQKGQVTYEQTSENWTSDAFRGRTVAPQGTIELDAPPGDALRVAGGHANGLVKRYDGSYRYGDGPIARVRFAELPEDPQALAALLEAAIRDGRWLPHPGRPNWAPGVAEEEVTRSAVILLSMGNLTAGQRRALFELLGSRPGARSLGDVHDAIGRQGVGVALPLASALGDELRMIIDPCTGDVLQSTEVLPPPPARLPQGTPRPPHWPPPVWLAQRTEVFLSTGSVAALGDRP